MAELIRWKGWFHSYPRPHPASYDWLAHRPTSGSLLETGKTSDTWLPRGSHRMTFGLVSAQSSCPDHHPGSRSNRLQPAQSAAKIRCKNPDALDLQARTIITPRTCRVKSTFSPYRNSGPSARLLRLSHTAVGHDVNGLRGSYKKYECSSGWFFSQVPLPPSRSVAVTLETSPFAPASGLVVAGWLRVFWRNCLFMLLVYLERLAANWERPHTSLGLPFPLRNMAVQNFANQSHRLQLLKVFQTR